MTTLAVEEAKRQILSPADTYTATDDISSRLKHLSEKKVSKLIKLGYPDDYLAPIYNCNICQDWGEVDGRVCDCVRRLRINELYKRSNLKSLLEVENFDTFNLEYYSNKPYKDRSATPYENASRILLSAKNFVRNFDKRDESLLIYGGTGLGKSFISNCIAKALLDSSHTVLYLSSNEMFEEIISPYIMSRDNDTRKKIEPIYEYIYNSDLLIIDDLGTEILSSFVKSQLFEVINKRILSGLSTIITTNLDLEALQDRYTERVMSRIVDKYTLYLLYGDDIRYVKKHG